MRDLRYDRNTVRIQCVEPPSKIKRQDLDIWEAENILGWVMMNSRGFSGAVGDRPCECVQHQL